MANSKERINRHLTVSVCEVADLRIIIQVKKSFLSPKTHQNIGCLAGWEQPLHHFSAQKTPHKRGQIAMKADGLGFRNKGA
jgi:hypothetical protein